MITVKGWASSAAMDRVRHVVAPTAFNDSIARQGITGPSGIKILAFHDVRKPVGRITKLESRNEGLWIEAEVDDEISYAGDLMRAAKAQGGFSFSIGFYVVDADIAEDPSGREYLLITKGDLLEVSIVVEPANQKATMEEIQ